MPDTPVRAGAHRTRRRPHTERETRPSPLTGPVGIRNVLVSQRRGDLEYPQSGVLFQLVAGIDDPALCEVRVVGHEFDRRTRLPEPFGEVAARIGIVFVTAVVEYNRAARD